MLLSCFSNAIVQQFPLKIHCKNHKISGPFSVRFDFRAHSSAARPPGRTLSSQVPNSAQKPQSRREKPPHLRRFAVFTAAALSGPSIYDMIRGILGAPRADRPGAPLEIRLGGDPMGSAQTKKQQYLAGVRSGLPVIAGFFPVGIAYALLARQAGMSPVETVLMSATVLAGSSQIMAAGMVLQGAGLAAVILATFVLNLRHLIMSTCIMRHFSDAPPGLRLLASLGVVDESFAVFSMEPEENHTISRFLGLFTIVYIAWVSAAVVGVLSTGLLPQILMDSMGIALYALFIAILLPSLRQNRRLTLLVLLTALCNALLSRLMDSSWALIASTLLCAALGTAFVDLDPQERKEDAGDAI